MNVFCSLCLSVVKHEWNRICVLQRLIFQLVPRFSRPQRRPGAELRDASGGDLELLLAAQKRLLLEFRQTLDVLRREWAPPGFARASRRTAASACRALQLRNGVQRLSKRIGVGHESCADDSRTVMSGRREMFCDKIHAVLCRCW